MRTSIACAFMALALAGCSFGGTQGGELIAANYSAADRLMDVARGQLDPARPIIVATIVDIDELERSSTLGRHISESVSSRFTQHRYRMIEMKFQNAVYMKKGEGELMLTRELREIASSHQAQAVIVGTYSRARNTVLVNVKLVQPETNVVLGAVDYALGVSRDICAMAWRDARDCREYH
jgi:TolB-like protein